MVLATGNAGKQRELAALLAPHGLELILQSTLCIAPIAETGTTFEANALLKARNAARASGLPALADDSGLEVDALGGRPGVHSARYAGEDATDEQNNALLLQRAGRQDRPAARRALPLRDRLVRGADDPAPLIASGSWEGRIAAAPRGEGGFGYDPLFIPRRLHHHRRADEPGRQERRQPSRQGAAATAATAGTARGMTGNEPAHVAATVAVRALSLVREQVPVLRLQLACAARSPARRPVRRRADRRPARAGATRGAARRRARSSACSWVAARPACSRPRAIARVLEALRAALPMSPDAEITLEANPATVERGRFAEYRAAGINRVSLGAQSFDRETLKALGRIHKVEDVHRAAEELHGCGLAQLQPGPDVRAAGAERRRRAVRPDLARWHCEPAHLSHYQLTLEPGTRVRAQPPPLPDDDLAFAMQAECHAVLAAHGFAQYEISAFARAGRQCVHNLNYWNFGDYLGLGAGAHGKLTRGRAGAAVIERSTHLREPRRYLASAAGGPEWRTVPAGRPALRVHDECAAPQRRAFARACSRTRTGLPLNPIAADACRAWRPRVSMEATGPAAGGPSPRGQLFLNDVIARFLPRQKFTSRDGQLGDFPQRIRSVRLLKLNEIRVNCVTLRNM